MKIKTSIWLTVLLAGATVESNAADTFLDAKSAGPDFVVQGEYVGTITSPNGEKNKLAAQVIALGGGKFRAVFHGGGLPGDGWDRETKIEVNGETLDGKTVFTAEDKTDGTAEISGGAFTGKSEKHGTLKLEKVMRKSPTEGLKPPSGALVLLDGKNADAWEGGHLDERGLLAAGSKTKQQTFQNYSLHVEFLLPFKPTGRGQDRANSGVYMQDRYEVQVLDSFGLKGLNNECGGIYSQVAPAVNMCYPPLQWQTYDIDFQAARYDGDGKKTKNAVITVKHNGIVIHENQEITGPTGGGKKEDSSGGAIQLQGHGNPVFYRNVWLVTK
jgi:hypothetical protein